MELLWRGQPTVRLPSWSPRVYGMSLHFVSGDKQNAPIYWSLEESASRKVPCNPKSGVLKCSRWITSINFQVNLGSCIALESCKTRCRREWVLQSCIGRQESAALRIPCVRPVDVDHEGSISVQRTSWELEDLKVEVRVCQDRTYASASGRIASTHTRYIHTQIVVCT